MEHDMTLRILIADDHGLLRAGLRAMLRSEEDMEVVGEAADGYEALTLSTRLKPDVVLADISMPGPSGIEVAQELKRLQPETRVLILTMHEDGGLLQEALRAGASGYLIKRGAEADLIGAIHTVSRGEIYVHDDMKPALPKDWRAPAAGPGSKGTQLTGQEADVLRLIAHGYTNRRIADMLALDSHSVESICSDLMAKLGVRGRVGLIQYANEHGIA